MIPTVVLPVVIGGLFAAGLYLLLDRSLTRVLLGFLMLGNATNLLLLTAGGPGGRAPILGFAAPNRMSDPLPHALILTAIVITFAASAFVLALIYRSWRLVRQEVVGVDEEDRRVAARSELDVDELDPDQLAPDDRIAGHEDSIPAGGGRTGDLPADDVDLPVGLPHAPGPGR